MGEGAERRRRRRRSSREEEQEEEEQRGRAGGGGGGAGGAGGVARTRNSLFQPKQVFPVLSKTGQLLSSQASSGGRMFQNREALGISFPKELLPSDFIRRGKYA
jgi:hypothetical protein